MGHRKVFRVVVNYCWEILTLVTDSFSFYCFSLILLFDEAVKELKTERKKDRDTFKLNFYFRGLRLFCGVERFPEPVEMAVLPDRERLRNIMESFLANCEFEGSPCVSIQ